MHLLYKVGNGVFRLESFYDEQIPPYAILSHTWGSDGDEVSFADLTRRRDEQQSAITSKPGHQKIEFCARKAADDGLQYFWVDTCCINKESDRELSEAINSMFRWYQRATKCYVYLSDFKASAGYLTSSNWNSFSQSRWFTRGWTLQELLAPKKVMFYDVYEHHLGDKTTLSAWITRITRIPHGALDGQPLSNFSVEDRLAWAQQRRTKREEDGAYCLLGIFGVSMPMIYGEGRGHAYGRLFNAIESSRQAAQAYQKYSQYLPSADSPQLGKALGQVINAVVGSSTSTIQVQLRPGEERMPTWDDDMKRYVQKHWSSEYQRHYRKHYIEGEGWVFLDWCA